jgi:hypothetical protein
VTLVGVVAMSGGGPPIVPALWFAATGWAIVAGGNTFRAVA